MKFRLGFFCLLLSSASAFAGDGLPVRGSADDYPAHQVSGKVAVGAIQVPPAQVKKIFGEDLDKRGYVVFEVAIFPADATQTDISADDFKLRQGKDESVVRAATPHMVASDARPQRTSTDPQVPRKVNVDTVDTIGYERGPYGHGVYTATSVGVGAGTPPNAGPGRPPTTAPAPAPPPSNDNDQVSLEQRLEDKSLPETKTSRAVAGYVYFPKPTADKRAPFELIYFGLDGQVTLQLTPAK